MCILSLCSKQIKIFLIYLSNPAFLLSWDSSTGAGGKKMVPQSQTFHFRGSVMKSVNLESVNLDLRQGNGCGFTHGIGKGTGEGEK